MKRQKKQPIIPSNLNSGTHNYEKRYTIKEVAARVNWNSLKWLIVCLLVGWGAYNMGHIIGKTEANAPIVNASFRTQ